MPQQDLDNFRKETAGLIGTIPGLKRTWVGKLSRPMTVEGKDSAGESMVSGSPARRFALRTRRFDSNVARLTSSARNRKSCN
jgi:hypothetical protein